MKRTMLAAVLFLSILVTSLFAVGCDNTSKEDAAQAPVNAGKQATSKHEDEVSPSDTSLSDNGTNETPEQEALAGEITDPKKLEELWQEYLYDTIATIGNAHEFNLAAEIDPIYIAEYSWKRYIADHGKESLALADEDSGSRNRVFPLETVQKYARRYFNLTSLDVTKLDEREYDQERRAFICRN